MNKFFRTMGMMVTMAAVHGQVFAQSVGFTGETIDIQWPWMKFFNSLAAQLTGPLPMVLGAMGIAGAGISLLNGHAGGGTQKFIIIIFVISICLFAPNFVTFISQSAGGLTLSGV